MPSIRRVIKSCPFADHICLNSRRDKKYFYCPVDKTRKLKKKTVLEHCQICDTCYDMMERLDQLDDQTELWIALGWEDLADDFSVSCESRLSAASAEHRAVSADEAEILRQYRARKRAEAVAKLNEDTEDESIAGTLKKVSFNSAKPKAPKKKPAASDSETEMTV
jgi:hypothetical protein